MTGIVLAGGKSSRLRRNKAFIQLDGKPLIERVLGVLERCCDEIIIIANRPEEYRHLGHRVYPDIYRGKGPLGGIHAGLSASDTRENFVVACDMPFLSPGLIAYLRGLAGSSDVVAPFVEGRFEPMHAVYARDCLGPIEQLLRVPGVPRIIEFYPMVRVTKVSRQEIEEFGPVDRLLCNINTEEDLGRLSRS